MSLFINANRQIDLFHIVNAHACIAHVTRYFSINGETLQITIRSGEPGLVDRVLALHAGSRGFDSHRGHMSEQFFRSNRPGYPHPVSSELELVVSEWR